MEKRNHFLARFKNVAKRISEVSLRRGHVRRFPSFRAFHYFAEKTSLIFSELERGVDMCRRGKLRMMMMKAQTRPNRHTTLSLASLTFVLVIAIFVNFANLSETYVAAEHITFDIPLIAVTPAQLCGREGRLAWSGLPLCQRLRVMPNECKFFI